MTDIPEDIPADVWAAAETHVPAWALAEGDDYTYRVCIARAIIAERIAAEKRGAERAAKVCDRVAVENRTIATSRLHAGDQHSAILHMERERTADGIAAAIRKEG